MLVLSRKVGQELVIGNNIRIVVSRVAGNRVSLGITAPDSVHVIRAELQDIRDEFAEQQSAVSPAVRTDLKTRVASRRESAAARVDSMPLPLEPEFETAGAELASSSVR